LFIPFSFAELFTIGETGANSGTTCEGFDPTWNYKSFAIGAGASCNFGTCLNDVTSRVGDNHITGSPIYFPAGIFVNGTVQFSVAAWDISTCTRFYLNGYLVCNICGFSSASQLKTLTCNIDPTQSYLGSLNSWTLYTSNGRWQYVGSVAGGLTASLCGESSSAAVKFSIYYLSPPNLSFSVSQFPAVIGQLVNFSVNFSGSRVGLCNYSLPPDVLNESVTLFYSNGSIVWSNLTERNSTGFYWNCDLTATNYSLSFQMPAPTESNWTQDLGKYSNLSRQWVRKELTNPSSVDYSNVSFMCLDSFNCSPASIPAYSSVNVSASGDALNESWGAWQQDSEKQCVAGGSAFVKKSLNATNLVGVNFSGIETNWVARGGWASSALNSIDLNVFANYFNSSFIQCNKDGVLSPSAGEWALDESVENNLSLQRFYRQASVSNLDVEVDYENVFASISPLEGNLSTRHETIEFDDISVPANGFWTGNATVQSDYVNESVWSERSGVWEKYFLNASNTTSGLKGIKARIDVDEAYVALEQYLKVKVGGVDYDITPTTECPSFTETIVENDFWLSCKEMSGGRVSAFQVLIPHFSTVLLEGGGRTLKELGESCASNSECASGLCKDGVCASQASDGNNLPPGGGGSAFNPPGATPTPQPTPTPSPTPSASNSFTEFIDIRVPDEVEIGWVTIGVFVNGAPANGSLNFFDPDSRKYSRAVGSDGTIRFFFDKIGNWLLKYGNKEKRVNVVKKSVGRSAASASPFPSAPSAITGFAALQIGPKEIGLIALFLIMLLVLYKLFYATVRVRKKLVEGKLVIEVRNRGGGLNNLLLVDVVPEDCSVANFSQEPERKETVVGTVFKWKRELLGKGERWMVECGFTQGKESTRLKAAELTATDATGKTIVKRSNELSL
jgi:hypothetical protein